LQSRVSALCGHALPPKSACARTVRLRVWEPAPEPLSHDTVHVDQAPKAAS
jgi:hypothetical protein